MRRSTQRANMAAWERILHVQLDLLDLLRDPFSERKREDGEGQKRRGRNKIILTNERTNLSITKSVPPPPTWKFIIRFHSR